MARMFNKYLVLRRDGTVPDWPYLVLGAVDPAVPYSQRKAPAGEGRNAGREATCCRPRPGSVAKSAGRDL